jgi:hypothetical protein
MRSLFARAVWALSAGAAVPACASSQAQRAAVIPFVLFDTVDQRLAMALGASLAQAQTHVKLSSTRDLEATLENGGPDTLSWLDLRALGKLLRVDVVVGVHACGSEPCVWVLADRLVWPSSPDTLKLRGPEWIQAATDTLARRFFRKPTGS